MTTTRRHTMPAQSVLSLLRGVSTSLLCAAMLRSCPGANNDLGVLPNTVRIEVTSKENSELSCSVEPAFFQAGYAHFANDSGIEDKHMFWGLFEARNNPEDAPIVLVFGGGPGTTGLGNVFFGAGPCMVAAGSDGQGDLEASLYSWTEELNILAIDHPIGVGFSYGDKGTLRNSSAQAAWDVDDFLQAFWIKYPHFVGNQFAIQSGSYGGTYIPHIVNTIYSRDLIATEQQQKTRILKMPEAVMMSNVWSDPQTNFRWFHESNCKDNKFLNETVCQQIVSSTPACLDAIQLAYEQPLLEYKKETMGICAEMIEDWTLQTDRNPTDVRVQCSGVEECYPEFAWFTHALNQETLRSAIGVPSFVNFTFLNTEDIGKPFMANGDHLQAAYLLLAPAIDTGLRLLVYNGELDGLCPWRSNLAWMKLLKTKHQVLFRQTEEVVYPGVGSVQQVGAGPGDYTFLRITNAGHFVESSQPQLVQHILTQWLKKEPFF